jgi:hypothetical protein
MLSAQIADRPLRELATVSPGDGSAATDVTATGTTASAAVLDAATATVSAPGGWSTVTAGKAASTVADVSL